jgi:hypothetical protein
LPDRIAPTYSRATWLFLRALGLVYLCAFASLAAQITGLIGHDGVLPARLYIDGARAWAAAEHVGLDRFHVLPTLVWISSSDAFLKILCIGGATLAALLVAGIAPIVMLPLLWLDYLSLMVVGRDFLSYQWDALLLETGLIAIFLAPLAWRDRLRDRGSPPRLAVWLMLWLLFRLMLGSGLVKLASGDPTWRSFTALLYHYETQPIPTPPAWYAHQLPAWLHRVSTFGTLAIEIVTPFFILGPRRLRRIAFVLFVGLQATIAFTGNYAFFNLLSASLCLFLLDDEMLASAARKGRPYQRHVDRDDDSVVGRPDTSSLVGRPFQGRLDRIRRAIVMVFAIVTVPVSAVAFSGSIGLPLPIALVEPLADFIAPLRSVNSYGLFAVMTTTRAEIVVEGSDDGVTWAEYEFKYKPGDLRRRPPWAAPHQPRLDWQMWFAALGRYESEAWFHSFCVRLLDGSPAVRQLLARDPFAGRSPRYVRGKLYRYRMADLSTRRRDGVWWTREDLGEYSPPLSLGGESR